MVVVHKFSTFVSGREGDLLYPLWSVQVHVALEGVPLITLPFNLVIKVIHSFK